MKTRYNPNPFKERWDTNNPKHIEWFKSKQKTLMMCFWAIENDEEIQVEGRFKSFEEEDFTKLQVEWTCPVCLKNNFAERIVKDYFYPFATDHKCPICASLYYLDWDLDCGSIMDVQLVEIHENHKP